MFIFSVEFEVFNWVNVLVIRCEVSLKVVVVELFLIVMLNRFFCELKFLMFLVYWNVRLLSGVIISLLVVFFLVVVDQVVIV